MKIILCNKPKKELIDEYFCYQLKQFQMATHETINLSEKDFWQKFYEWLNIRKKSEKNYCKLLKEMNINYQTTRTAEINKGVYDTITYEKNTTLITPYIYGFHNKKNNKIIKGALQISFKPKVYPAIDCLITQNPYQEKNLEKWEYLFYSNYYTTAVGIFGSIYDKDKEQKRKELENFKDKLIGINYKEEQVQIGDNYYHLLTSYKKNEKVLARTR